MSQLLSTLWKMIWKQKKPIFSQHIYKAAIAQYSPKVDLALRSVHYTRKYHRLHLQQTDWDLLSTGKPTHHGRENEIETG